MVARCIVCGSKAKNKYCVKHLKERKELEKKLRKAWGTDEHFIFYGGHKIVLRIEEMSVQGLKEQLDVSRRRASYSFAKKRKDSF